MQQNQCQQIQQNPFPHQACAMNMNFGAQRVNGCCNSFMGRPFGNQFGGGAISNFAMAGAGVGGAFALAGSSSLGGGFNNLFSSPFSSFGGNSFNSFGNSFGGNSFGNGLGFGTPFAGGLPFGGSNLNLSLGISLNA